MPASWSPRFGIGQPLTANEIGRQASPFVQQQITPSFAVQNEPYRARFRTDTNPDRPYSDVGKMSVNLGSLAGQTAKNAQQTQGFFGGLGAGAGRLIGGVIGQGQAGADIGEFVGNIANVPFDIAGNALGIVPAMPFLPGSAGGMTGGKSVFDLPFMDEDERNKILEGWDNNPMSLIKHMSEWNKHDWSERIGAGEFSPLFGDLAPAASIGDQLMQVLGVFNLGARGVERTLAGGPLDAIGRIMNTPTGGLNPEVEDLKNRYMAGEIGRDELLDELVMHNAGYSNDWGLNLLGGMVLDPLLIGGQVAGMAGKATVLAKMAKAENFVKLAGKEGFTALAQNIQRRAAEEGVSLGGEGITNKMIMEEAQRAGLHGDALAEASKQLTARQKILADTAHLEPIFTAAQKVSDPVSGAFGMIGRRGQKVVPEAWLNSQATRGVAAAFGDHNFRHVQNALDRLGKLKLFNDAMGYFVAQEGMAMEGEMLAKDVMSVQNVSDARPAQLARARLQQGTQQYDRQMEAFVGRRKVDLARATGLGTGEAAMERARQQVVTKMVKQFGISGEEARKIVGGLDADGLSMMDAAFYGRRVERFNEAMRLGREAIASSHAVGKLKSAGEMLDRTTLIGSRELSFGRGKILKDLLADTRVSTAEKAVAAREAVRQYDRLFSNFTADGPSDAEIVTDVARWLDSHGDGLTKELTDDQLSKLPKEVLDDLDPEDGYIYGLRPENGKAEWRLAFDPDDPTKIISADPWMDIVGDKAQPWNARFNNDSAIGSKLNALDRAVGAMTHQITTERIFSEARRDFIQKGMNGYMPSQKTALTYEQGNMLWKSLLDHAKDLGTTPRGMTMGEFQKVIDKTGVASAGISARDLMGMTLHSFEGRIGTVGVTQKISGKIKSASGDITGGNAIGRMAERVYPLVRFSINPYFQLQEWVEPWVFAAARGKQARLTGGWHTVDPVTGQMVKVEPTEVMRIQQNLIDRYQAANPYAHFDQMEMSLVYLHGSKAAKDASALVDPTRLETARNILSKRPMTAGNRKALAQSEMFRHFLGPMLKERLNSISPTTWAELEMEYGTRDMGTIAIRWLTEKDVWAAMDPQAANHLTGAAKARRIGATSAVDVEGISKYTFKTTPDALTLSIKDGTLLLDDFTDQMRHIGAADDYINRAWKALKFEAKTGGMDEFWAQGTRGPGARSAVEVANVRALVKVWAESQGVTELEFVSRTLDGHMLSLLHDDLIDMLDNDLVSRDALFQTAEDAFNYFSTDPVTGARIPESLTPEEARARFLSRSAVPPSDLPLEHHGAYADMQEVPFGAGRSVFIPGGLKALQDPTTPWTVWEAHLIRAQMLNPNDLLDVELKHAMYEKLWRGHTIDMADPNSTFRLFNNVVMAMTSSQMNLTKNEALASRLRITSQADLVARAGEARALRKQIQDSYPPGADIPDGDLGLAYSTSPHMAHYIGIDSVEDFARLAYRPARGEAIQTRARIAREYLDGANIGRHTKIAKDNPERKVGRITEWAIDEAARVITEAKGVHGLQELSADFKPNLKAVLGEANETRFMEAAAAVVKDPFDVAARDVLAELVGTKATDDVIAWKPWNVNGAGKPYAKTPDGRVIGHGDKPIFGYVKNEDVKWRNLTTNAGIGNSLRLVEDMVDNPQHYVRRSGPEYAPAVARKGEPVAGYDLHFEDDPFTSFYDREGMRFSESSFGTSGNGRSVQVTDANGKVIGFVYAALDPETNTMKVMQSQVLDPHGRKGIGNWMYRQLEEQTGATLVPAREQSPTARALWAQPDRPFGPQERALREYQTGLGTGKVQPVGEAKAVDPADLPTFKEVGEEYWPVDIDTFNDPTLAKMNPVSMTPDGRLVSIDDRARVQAARQQGVQVKTQVVDFAKAQDRLPEPARFGRDARGNATVPTQFKSEPGFVYRTVNQSRAASDWRVGEYVARHPATIYAESDNSVVLRTRQDIVPWDEAKGGVGAHQNLQARSAVTAGNVEMLTADGTWVPVRAQEPLDEFAERVGHRTRGLSLKTSYFGVDLGDPMTFERGVMDTHMVGGLTEHMYHDLTKGGTLPRWKTWLASLSDDKQKLIQKWIDKGAPTGAGSFDWAEATGLDLSLKPGAVEKASLDQALKNGQTATVAAYVRRRIEAAVANNKSKFSQAEADRLYKMYRNDDELAELYDRDIKVFGGDYRIYEDLMTERKAAESVTDPTLARHRNGGYQWKLWDDRRNIYDPEVVTFRGAHTLEPRSAKLMAASDDVHGFSGFMDEGGLRPIQETGERFLDPHTTAMYQRSGKNIRGATIFSDQADTVVAITEHSNASTLTHELVHALLEPLLDVSGKNVVLDDLNAMTARFNDGLVESTATARVALERATTVVTDTQSALIEAERAVKEATVDARTKTSAATKAERDAKVLADRATHQMGAFNQLKRDATARRKAANAQPTPSQRARANAALDKALAKGQATLDTVIARRDEVQGRIEGLWDEANAAEATLKDLDQNAGIIRTTLTQNKAEGAAARAEFDRLATSTKRAVKDVWDDDVSEHFAEQFQVWLRTGKAENPKLRDAFAYFHRVLSRLEDWVKGNPQVKVSPAMEALFNKLHAPHVDEAVEFSNPIHFDATQEAMHAAGRQSVVDAEDAAHTNVQFRRSRSVFERSVNHPYMGIYPSSYMWGKVMPEMIRALALNPFGLPIPGMVSGATPGMGFLNAQRVWSAVEMQKDSDPDFHEMMTDPKNSKAFRALSMMVPSTPWDTPANYALWARRLAESGLEDQDRVAAGEEPKGYDIPQVAGEVMGYTFGPAASFDWLKDILKISDAPVVTQFTEGTDASGMEGLGAGDLVIRPDGTSQNLDQVLKEASGNLQSSLTR